MCPRSGEEKREEDSKPSLSSKKGFVGEKKRISFLKKNHWVSIFPEIKY